MIQQILLIAIFAAAILYLIWHFRKSASQDANCKTGCGCTPISKPLKEKI